MSIDKSRFPAASDANSVSEFFDVLSDERRRTALHVLSARSMPADIVTIARAIAIEEGDANGDGPDPDPDTVDRILLSLAHHHLPKLDDIGWIEYDFRRRVVEEKADVVDAVGRRPIRA